MKGWKRHEPGSGCFVATQELRAKSKQKKKIKNSRNVTIFPSDLKTPNRRTIPGSRARV
tara:strand:- start:3423 stop:3599 length:177 start_codon:yes stop_codon:yes gene_type:complete